MQGFVKPMSRFGEREKNLRGSHSYENFISAWLARPMRADGSTALPARRSMPLLFVPVCLVPNFAPAEATSRRRPGYAPAELVMQLDRRVVREGMFASR